MSEPRRHHWIPRFYLRNFAIPETLNLKSPQVWALHRHRGDETPVAITNVGVQKDLYSVTGSDGHRDVTVERELAELESVVGDHRFWPLLSNDFIDLAHLPYRKIIALFLATLFIRNPARLAQNIALHNKIVNFVESAPKDDLGRPRLQELGIGRQRISFDHAEWEEYRKQTEGDVHRVFLETMRQSAGWIAQKLLTKRWSIVVAEHPLFVTSTSPLVVLNPELKPFQILGPNSMLMWPISPTRVLCLDELDQPGNQYYPLRELKAVGLYTYSSWVNTDHFLLSPRPIDVVLGEMTEFLDGEQRRQRAQEMASLISDYAALNPGKSGRNDPCLCGSGVKYKKCCGRVG